MNIITEFDNRKKKHAADKKTTNPNLTANANTIIEVKNLVKYYGSNLSLDNVSFTIGKGKICGLWGPNGAGKTTKDPLITELKNLSINMPPFPTALPLNTSTRCSIRRLCRNTEPNKTALSLPAPIRTSKKLSLLPI